MNRWLNSDNKFVDNGSSLPFGFGKRRCLGEQLATSELYLVLANLFIDYKFVFDAKNENIDIKTSQTVAKEIDPQIGVIVQCRV